MKTRSIWRHGGPLAALALLLVGSPAGAQVPRLEKVCRPSSVNTDLLYLRRLTLQLRGRAPTIAEQIKVLEAGRVPESLIDEMLDSEDFVTRIRDYHRDLLWTNIANTQVTNNRFLLSGNGSTTPYYAPGRRLLYRKRSVSCWNVPAQWDASGKLVTVDGREGYVEVEPYWAPGTKVKVCAFDAQTTASVVNRGRTYSCSSYTRSPACGCGPNLRWCHARSGPTLGGRATYLRVLDAMSEQILRLAADIVRRNRPYTDIITALDMEVNGPLVHWMKYQYQNGTAYIYARNDWGFTLPPLTFDQVNTWVRVQRSRTYAGHAGVLTMPGYLMRFTSWRGRAHRFYNAFMCKQFQAAGNLPPGNHPCNSEPDLRVRCACESCHRTLEPLKAYWGRWAKQGVVRLDPKVFPTYKASCADVKPGRRPGSCSRFYVYKDPHPKYRPYLGKLLPYLFATPEMERNIEAGPRALAEKTIADGTFARCTAKKLWAYFSASEADCSGVDGLITTLATKLVSSGYNIKAMVKALVMSPQFRTLAAAKK